MSAPISLASSSQCCTPSCTDVATAQIPGPAGTNGTNGTPGSSGHNAYTTTTASFTMPAVGGTVNIAVVSSSWVANGQFLFVSAAGQFQVTNLFDSTHIEIKNLGYTGNVAPATVIPAPQQVSPGGQKGLDGSGPSVTLNQLSPSIQRGDVLADNGANAPLASLVRLGVGTNGKALVADSTQPTGLLYATITPNSVTNANDIPRFSGTTGTPMAIKDSKLLITDDGAIQSTPTGGNARGSKAVDLQVDRVSATSVASGVDSVVTGGLDNKASGDYSVVAGGNANIASGIGAAALSGTTNLANATASVVAGGSANTASGQFSFVGAGTTNTASAANASVVAGTSNTASAQSSTVLGGDTNTASGLNSVAGGKQAVANKYGQVTFASGAFAAPGDAQNSSVIWRTSTTDATANVEAFLDGSALRATVPLNTTWTFDILITGRSSAGVSACWRVVGGVQNNANTVSLVAAVTTTVLGDGTGGTWGVAGSVAVTADNVNKSLKIAVTGVVATNIRWVAQARLVECNF